MQSLHRPVYLDVSALGRLYDSLDQERVRRERDSVQLIIEDVVSGVRVLVTSPILRREIAANPFRRNREALQWLLAEFGIEAEATSMQIRTRVTTLVALRLNMGDALHFAFAEVAGADFVTCDDRLLARLRTIGITLWHGTPVQFCIREGIL